MTAQMQEAPAWVALAFHPTLQAVVDAAPEDAREAVLARLVGPSPTAEIVAAVLTSNGRPVSATTIRTYRRNVARTGRAA